MGNAGTTNGTNGGGSGDGDGRGWGRLSELTGGNFKDGFIGAGAGALLGYMIGISNKGLGLGAPGTGGTGWPFLGQTDRGSL